MKNKEQLIAKLNSLRTKINEARLSIVEECQDLYDEIKEEYGEETFTVVEVKGKPIVEFDLGGRLEEITGDDLGDLDFEDLEYVEDALSDMITDLGGEADF